MTVLEGTFGGSSHLDIAADNDKAVFCYSRASGVLANVSINGAAMHGAAWAMVPTHAARIHCGGPSTAACMHACAGTRTRTCTCGEPP